MSKENDEFANPKFPIGSKIALIALIGLGIYGYGLLSKDKVKAALPTAPSESVQTDTQRKSVEVEQGKWSPRMLTTNLQSDTGTDVWVRFDGKDATKQQWIGGNYTAPWQAEFVQVMSDKRNITVVGTPYQGPRM